MANAGRRRYEVLSTLGQGGFGTVVRADLIGDGGFRKTVALKVLNPELGHQAELARRLRDEARILGLLRHRAVVHVDDLVQLDGRWTVVMEYVDGVDLSLVVAHGAMPPRPALEVVQEVASALHVAWTTPGPEGGALRIVHRDIKPGNILVSAAGEVKVLDFGIARAEFDERESVTRSVGFGSPDYMAPERLEWQSGPESDVYSLGCVLYELLTGARFGRSSGHPGRHGAKVAEALARLQARLGPEGEGIVELVGRMLAYELEERPTARALERACDRLIGVAGGDRLRDWAEENVPRLQKTRGHAPPSSLAGAILVEATTPTGSGSQPTLAGEFDGWDDDLAPQDQAPAPPASQLATWMPEDDLVDAAAGEEAAGGEAADEELTAGEGAQAPPPEVEAAREVETAPAEAQEPAAASPAPVPVASAEPERAAPPAAAEEEPPLERAPRSALGLVAGLGACAVVALVAFLLWPESGPSSTAPALLEPVPAAEVATPPPPAPAAPEPELPSAAPTPEPEPSPAAADASTGAPSSNQELKKAAPAPAREEVVTRAARETEAPASAAPESPSAASTTGQVTVSGDADHVVLLGASGAVTVPGSVPAGTYTVQVTFPGREAIASGSVTVPAGGRVSLACNAQFKRCSAR